MGENRETAEHAAQSGHAFPELRLIVAHSTIPNDNSILSCFALD